MDSKTIDGAMEQHNEMEARLWAYIDGISEETTVVESLIAENGQWRKKYAELLDVHHLAQSFELDEPSLRFTKNVMEEISRLQIAPAAKRYINTKIIRGIAAFFITVITGLLVFGLSQVNWSVEINANDTVVNLTAIDYSHMFNITFVNLFMMANVILGLLLLDRFIASKRKKFIQQQFR